LLGSHRLTSRSVHWPDQSGYWACAMVGTAVPMSPIRAMKRIVHRTLIAASPGRLLTTPGPDWTLDRATLSDWLGRCYGALAAAIAISASEPWAVQRCCVR